MEEFLVEVKKEENEPNDHSKYYNMFLYLLEYIHLLANLCKSRN